jgi:phage gp36-like protein
MPYCTLDDIKSKRIPEGTLVQLTDDADTGTVDETVVAGIIGDADELIDGYLRGRYVLPLEPMAGIVKTLSVDVSVYNLYGRRPEFDTPKAVGEKYTAAVKILEGIQAGKITLGSAGVTSPTPVEPADGMRVSAPGKVFSEDVLDRY